MAKSDAQLLYCPVLVDVTNRCAVFLKNYNNTGLFCHKYFVEFITYLEHIDDIQMCF